MAETWPATLPEFMLLEGAVEGLADGRIFFDADTGPGKVRRRSTARPRPLQGRMIVTTEQLATFRTFVDTTLMSGALSYTMTDQTLLTGTIRVRFNPKAGLPSWRKLRTDTYEIPMDLEILPS